MANCSSSRYGGSCGASTRSGYGVLNCVGRCGQRNVYYSGPCPDAPCSGCGCGSNPPPYPDFPPTPCAESACCSGCSGCSGCAQSGALFATFSIYGPVDVAAGGAIGLTMRDANTNLFTVEGGRILLRAPGVYYAAVTADIPTEIATNTVLQTELNSRVLTQPQIAIETATTGTAASNFAGQAVFQADCGSVLRLLSQDALSVTTATAQPLFTLTLIRL